MLKFIFNGLALSDNRSIFTVWQKYGPKGQLGSGNCCRTFGSADDAAGGNIANGDLYDLTGDWGNAEVIESGSRKQESGNARERSSNRAFIFNGVFV